MKLSILIFALIAVAAARSAGAADAMPTILDAAAKGDLALTRALLAKGANPNIRGPAGQTPLMLAAMRGHTTVVDLLLNSGAEIQASGTPNFKVGPRDYSPELGNCYTAAMLAALGGHRTTLELLLSRGAATPCAKTGFLSLAVVGRPVETPAQVELVQWLIGRETPTAFDRNISFFEKHPKVRALLQGEKPDRSGDVFLHALMGIALRHSYDETFYEFGDGDWWTAAGKGDVNRLEALLLSKQVDVNAKDDRGGGTALISVATSEAPSVLDVIAFLLKNGADINAADSRGRTALIAAAESYSYMGERFPNAAKIIKALLDGGANPALKDADGRTALDHARKKGDSDVTRLLQGAIR